MVVFGSVLHSCTSGTLARMLSFFPWRITRAHLALCGTTLGEGGFRHKLPLLFSNVFNYDCLFICSNNVLELLCWTPGLPQKLSRPLVIV